MAKIDIARMKVGVDLEVNKSQLDSLKRDFDSLSVSAKLPGKELDAGLQQAGQTARQVSTILDQSFNKKLNSLDVTKFSQELSKAGLSMQTLKDNLSKAGTSGSKAFNDLTSEILGTNIQLKQTSTFLDKMSVTMANTIRFGISSAVFNNLTSAISKSWEYTKKLDKSLNDIRIVSGQSADQMDRFAKRANEAAKNLGSNTLDYTKAALIYYQQGLPESEIQSRTDTTIKMANVLGSSAEEVSDYLTAIWNNFYDGSKSLEYYADVITKLGAATASSAEEIAGGLEKFAAVGDTIGLSYEYATAALTTITAQTRQSEDVVGTALKTIFSRIQGLSLGDTLDDGTTLNKYSEALARVGISIKDQDGQLRDMDSILDDLGSKWKTLNKDQQVGLAQTVAGVRQYNQLVALMDNWDFMKENLETAANAQGELNAENEIYMESTEAHLKTLQASWEGLYQTMFDTKEINPLIDGFSEIIEGINGVAESFGGGAKSLAGFGAMFVNVFQKQIDRALTRFIANSNAAKENLAYFKTMSETVSAGADMNASTPTEKASAEAASRQVENAERLMAVYDKMDETEAHRLISLTKETAELERQAILMEENSREQINQSVNNLSGTISEDESIELESVKGDYEELNALLGEMVENHQISVEEIEMETSALEGLLNDYNEEKSTLEDINDIKQRISKIMSRSNSSLVNDLKKEKDQLKTGKLTADQKQRILTLAKQISKEEGKVTDQVKKTAKEVENENKNRKKSSDLQDQVKNNNQQIDKALQPAEKTAPLIGTVNGLTASVSALTTAWAGLNSITSIWGDYANGDISAGEAIMQTLTSVTMILPGAISAFKTLKTMQDSYAASKAASIAAAKAEAEAMQENTLAKEAAASATATSTEAEVADTAATAASTVAETADAAASTAGAAAEGADAVATTADTTAKGANAVATGIATAAQAAFNAVCMINPVVLLIAGLTAAVGAFAIFSAAAKKSREAQKEMNEETYKNAVAEKEEAQERKNNADAFLELYKQYQNGTKSKEDLAKATDSLTKLLGKEDIEVAKLTGNYDNLIEKIKAARKEALSNEINSLETEKSSAEELMKGNAYDAKPTSSKDGYLVVNGSGNHGLSYGDEFSDKDFSQWLADQGYYDFLADFKQNDDGTYTRSMGIRTKEDAESMSKLKGYWDEYVKATNDKDSAYHVSTKEKADSEMYQSYKKFFDAYSGDLENYEKAKKELGEKQAEQEVYNTDFSKVTEASDYATKRDKIREQLKKSGQATGKSDAEINNEIDEYASQFNDGLSEIIQKTNTVENAYEHLKTTITDSDLEKNLMGLSLNQVAGLTVENADKIKAEYDALKEKGLSSAEAIKELGEKYKVLGAQVDSIVGNMGEDNLKEWGLEKEDLKDYSKYLIDIADDTENLNDAMEDNDAAAVTVAKSIMRMNNGIEKLYDNQENWLDVLKKSSIESEEYFDALQGLRDAIGDLFDLSEDTEKFLDGEFFKDNAELIKQAAEGSADAIDKLRNATADAILVKILVDNEFDQSQISVFQAYLDDLQNSIPKIKVGTELSLDGMDEAQTEFFNKCQQIVNAAGMTAEQASAFFESMGFEAQFETEQKPVVKQGHGTRTVTEMKKAMDVKMPDGTTMTVPSGWETKTYPGEPYTYVDYVDAIAMTTDGTAPKIKSITKKGTGSFNNFSSSNKGGASSPGKSSGGGGSKSEPSKKDLNEDKVDRYEKVNVQLERLSAKISKIQSQEGKFIGQKLLDNLNEQIGLLNQQIDRTNEKMRIAREEQAELQGTLRGFGVGFDSDGVMTNYAQVFAQQQAALNAVYNHYNSLSADAQKGYEDTVEAAEKRWEKFKEAVSDYDNLIGNMIPGLEKDIQDAIDKQIEIKIKEFDMEIELALDIKDAQDKWNDFRKSIIKDLKDDDILGNALDSLERFADYYNQAGVGVLQEETKYLQDLMKQMDQYNTTGWSDWYGNNESAMMEDLRKYYEQAFDDLQNVKDLVDEIHEALNETLEDVADRMEEQMDYYDTISDTLEHDMKMVELVYGDEAFGKLELYYSEQEKNYNNQLEFQRAQVDFWRQQMDALDKGSEEWETARDNWLDAVGEWQSMVESAIENLTDKYLNTINKIFQELNNQVTKGAGMDFINTEWELIQKHADEYLDTINSTYGIQQLQNKYLDAMNNTDNLAYQRKLNELMKAEVADLKARDRLTQYDLDRAELKYQIALKQIALQEAQQNKSTMRLKRDTQGNYTYQYVSDDDEVKKVQEEISDLYNQLYNLDVDRYTGNLDQLYEIWMEYQEKMAEAAAINDPEARLQKEQLLTQQYGDLINGIVDQNEQIKRNLYESTFLELEDLYGKQAEIVQDFLDNQDDAMSLLVNGWASGLQEMADQIYAEGGFEPTYEQALADITEATADYEESLKQLQDSAKVTFETLGEDVDEVETEVQQLINKTDELISTFGNEVAQIKDVIGQIDELNNHYQQQTKVINTAIDAYNKYIQKMREAEQAANKNTSSNGGSGQPTGGASGNGSSGGGGGNANRMPSVGQWATYNGGYYYGDSYGGGGRGSRGPGKRVKVTIVKNDGRPYPIHVESSDSAYGWLRKDQLSGYDTGGYTGSWGSTEGRVALLHEKELVLNKEDTKNLLDTVEVMRNLTNSLGSSILKQMASMSRTGINGMVGGDVVEQDVHIDAQFPNVRDSREIENALNNLVNAAAQRANKR